MSHSFENIISLENLCLAWEEFIIGKKHKRDVIKFSRNLMDHIVELHEFLVNHTYCHGGYESFFVNDPKRRHIHKASVRDRLLHHAVYRLLYPFFEKTFIADSFSCQLNKGTHKAVNRFRTMFYQVSQNDTNTCWVLKCDIRKFFASIDHQILLNILEEYILDKDILWLLKNIIESYQSDKHLGLPLGNLTSQLFANIYMNVFDQYVKHKLNVKHYIRYADDFVFLFTDKQWLIDILPKVRLFLKEQLKLDLHPNKVFLKTFSSGIDFLGWINFSKHCLLRKSTKKRMFARIRNNPKPVTLQSYLGLLQHGNTFRVREKLLLDYWVCGDG